MIGKKLVHLAGVGEVEVSVLSGHAECYLINDQVREPLNWGVLRKKNRHAAAALKTDCRAIDQVLASQKQRLEFSWTSSTSWLWTDLKRNWFEHPLVAPLAWRLIWRFGDGEHLRDGLWDDGSFRDATGNLLAPISPDTPARLWHPAESPLTVEAWRKRLHNDDIVQPIRQAFREVYLVTEAEHQASCDSARFAGHILKQQQLAAIASARGWTVDRVGPFDSCSHLEKSIQGGQYVASWRGDPVGQETDGVFFRLIRMKPVHFSPPFGEIPPVIFSELMRDVDLFVSVASIAVDSAWSSEQSPPEIVHYWSAFTNSELTESGLLRRKVLNLILPSLGDPEAFVIEGKHLVVRGKRYTYRIHLQSGAVFQQPSNKHICIVPKPVAGSSRTSLLTGDPILSIIVSKALLLARDDKIRDPNILSQLGG